MKSEKYFVVEDFRDGTLECPLWCRTKADATKEAEKQQKGLRHEEHAILVCQVLEVYEYEDGKEASA